MQGRGKLSAPSFVIGQTEQITVQPIKGDINGTEASGNFAIYDVPVADGFRLLDMDIIYSD